jgi:hypothetical protein
MQTRPGAGQISSRQTCTGAAQTFVVRHVQVQDNSLLNRHTQVQHRLLLADTSRCRTNLFKTDTCRCSSDSCMQTHSGAGKISSRKTRPGAAQTFGDRHLQVQYKATIVDRHAQEQRRLLKTDTSRCDPRRTRNSFRLTTSRSSVSCCRLG